MAGYQEKHPSQQQPPPHQQQQHRPPQGYGARPDYRQQQQQQGYGGAPANYGQPSPPVQHNAFAAPPNPGMAYGQRPPPMSRPPPTPAPPGGADPTLYPLFKAVDKDGA